MEPTHNEQSLPADSVPDHADGSPEGVHREALVYGNGREQNPFAAPQTAEQAVAESAVQPSDEPPPRMVMLPVALLVLTCLSTFVVGATGIGFLWVGNWIDSFRLTWIRTLANWQNGLLYTGLLMAILMAHEMGHFLFSLYHRVAASLPFFIPMPIGYLGTMGAVIAMDSLGANRKQLFDIGIAGPLAGLVLAVPITVYGILIAGPAPPPLQIPGTTWFQDPLLVELLIRWLRPEVASGELIMNPWLMAGWVGFLLTGLNMMPVSQLDGGHVSYALFGRFGHWVARIFILAAIGLVLYFWLLTWVLLLVLVILIGVDHPPTRDDTVPLNPVRVVLGVLSLTIPILCFPPLGIVQT